MKIKLIFTIATIIHNLASTFWAGSLFFLVLIYFPSMKKFYNKKFNKTMNNKKSLNNDINTDANTNKNIDKNFNTNTNKNKNKNINTNIDTNTNINTYIEKQKFHQPPFFDGLTIYVLISLVLIIVSGLILKGVKEYSQTYKILHTLKFILTGLMTLLIILRQKFRLSCKKYNSYLNEKKMVFPIFINSVLIFFILIISVIMRTF